MSGTPYADRSQSDEAGEMLVGTIHAHHNVQLSHQFQFLRQFQLPCNALRTGKDSSPLAEHLTFDFARSKEKHARAGIGSQPLDELLGDTIG